MRGIVALARGAVGMGERVALERGGLWEWEGQIPPRRPE